jgi:hypothetical protein
MAQALMCFTLQALMSLPVLVVRHSSALGCPAAMVVTLRDMDDAKVPPESC